MLVCIKRTFHSFTLGLFNTAQEMLKVYNILTQNVSSLKLVSGIADCVHLQWLCPYSRLYVYGPYEEINVQCTIIYTNIFTIQPNHLPNIV